EETTNVDIRYRGELGHTVSGKVTNPPDSQSAIFFTLSSGLAGGAQSRTGSYNRGERNGFAFYGVDEGDYMIMARASLSTGEWSISQPQRISVRGSDVAGIELTLKPLGSVSGQVVLEELKTKECGSKETPVLTETLVSAWHKPDEAAKALPSFVWGMGTPASS